MDTGRPVTLDVQIMTSKRRHATSFACGPVLSCHRKLYDQGERRRSLQQLHADNQATLRTLTALRHVR